jgi:FeS assembly SUF system protein
MDIIKLDAVPPLPPSRDVDRDSIESEAPPQRSGDAGPAGDPLKTLELKPRIIEALSTVYDPEIPVNIYELGLIYDIIVDATGAVTVKMTLTAPGCPAALSLPGEVGSKVGEVAGVTAAHVELVWDPPWSKDRMSEAAKLQLGIPW